MRVLETQRIAQAGSGVVKKAEIHSTEFLLSEYSAYSQIRFWSNQTKPNSRNEHDIKPGRSRKFQDRFKWSWFALEAFRFAQTVELASVICMRVSRYDRVQFTVHVHKLAFRQINDSNVSFSHYISLIKLSTHETKFNEFPFAHSFR